MKIKWLGHSCFLLTSEKGTRVLTDPFNEQVGYELPRVEADIVTTSHGHFDHNHVSAVKGSFVCFDKPGSFGGDGIEIKGIATSHDGQYGTKRGPNTIFKFVIDGINICHCGDLGHLLTGGQIGEIGKVDVLMVPVGGIFTIDYSEALEVAAQLMPDVIIPMHFKTEVLKFDLDGVDRFLTAAGRGERLDKQEIDITRDTMASIPSIVVLNCK